MTTLAPPRARLAPPSTEEHRQTFPCFGSQCTVIVAGGAGAPRAARAAKAKLLDWHFRYSRFEPDSELTRLNRDPRATVPISPLLRRIIEAGLEAARRTGGLVDPTLHDAIERAGYATDLIAPALPLATALRESAHRRAPARPHPDRAWQRVHVDRRSGTVTRPPGVKLDSGGIAKGVFADELAALLAPHDAFVADCGGDIRIGGRTAPRREVHVASPYAEDDAPLHTFLLSRAAIATSGIARRSWRSDDGAPAHHLLDPSTGRPAYTGVIQATAVAATTAEAEALSKAALLSGPDRARTILAHGGVFVEDDGSVTVIEPA